MEDIGNLEDLVAADSYESEEHCYLITSNNATISSHWVPSEPPKATTPPPSSSSKLHNQNSNSAGEEEEEEEEESSFKFYAEWFHAFLAKHGFDIDHLDFKHSSVQQLEKSWLNKQVSVAQMRSKEAEVDVNFINLRYAICKQWLSSI